MYTKFVKKGVKSGPTVYVVGGVHGDEPIGLKVIRELKSLTVARGILVLIIAHPKALAKKKRFLQTDLNRSFNGKSKAIEERLAKKLVKEFAQADFLIDIHATNSNFKELLIATSMDAGVKKLLSLVPIKKVLYVPKKIFGGHELISSVKKAIALEYGPDKTGKNYPLALAHVVGILSSLGVINKKVSKNKNNTKELYTASFAYTVPKAFIQHRALKDFTLIKKGGYIGTSQEKKLYSTDAFYPVFLGKGRYAKTLAIAARSKKVISL